ncbi:hypothetical protein HGB25_00505 [Candidatus Saccharibacteria bacterium]|nr:hypothetical protein [Candidatus Saccharibacteria bacterium]
MKKMIKSILSGLLIVPALVMGVLLTTSLSQPTYAKCDGTETTGICAGAKDAKGDGQQEDLFKGSNPIFKNITNAALYIIGALSVIMLIWGGIRYTISMGDSKNVEAAKSTIMYAIIGVVVALLSYAIVNYVLTTL